MSSQGRQRKRKEEGERERKRGWGDTRGRRAREQGQLTQRPERE